VSSSSGFVAESEFGGRSAEAIINGEECARGNDLGR
jgi:hypothetical protein